MEISDNSDSELEVIDELLKVGEVFLNPKRNIIYCCRCCGRNYDNVVLFVQHIIQNESESETGSEQDDIPLNDHNEQYAKNKTKKQVIEKLEISTHNHEDIIDEIEAENLDCDNVDSNIDAIEFAYNLSDEADDTDDDDIEVEINDEVETDNNNESDNNDYGTEEQDENDQEDDNDDEESYLKPTNANEAELRLKPTLHQSKTQNMREILLRIREIKKNRVKSIHKCSLCDFQSLNEQKLSDHCIEAHNIRIYNCDICGFGFRTRSNLGLHRRRHNEVGQHCCAFCGKRFHTTSELNSHERHHTGERPYTCKQCGLTFPTSGHATQHATRRHSNERNHPCEQCGKRFKTKASLKNHSVVHTREKHFKCVDCNVRFSRLAAYKNHTKLHRNAKEYICECCPMAFNQRAGLYSHMVNKHKTKPSMPTMQAMMTSAENGK